MVPTVGQRRAYQAPVDGRGQLGPAGAQDYVSAFNMWQLYKPASARAWRALAEGISTALSGAHWACPGALDRCPQSSRSAFKELGC